MRSRTLHPEELLVIRRLQAVGCPLEYRYLSSLHTYPLQVVSLNPAWGTHIFPMPGKTGVVLPLRIIATAPITISKYDLRADWLSTAVSWNPICPEHGGKGSYYCLHGTSYGDLQIKLTNALNPRTGVRHGPAGLLASGVLRRSMELKGFLVGTFPDLLPIAAGTNREATLYITDLFGQEYPFPLVLENREPPIETENEDLNPDN